jgi:hypothetical protein
MTKDDNKTSCDTHGESYCAYICCHVAANPTQRWFCNLPSEADRWPNAWCEKCEAGLVAEGEWNDRSLAELAPKLICHNCYESMMAQSLDSMSEAKQAEWDGLVATCHQVVHEKQAALDKKYEISKHKRWDYDQATASLTFSNDGVAAVIADVEFIGSYSKSGKTWLWSWANFSLLPSVRTRIEAVAEYGEENGLLHLLVPIYPANEIDSWELAGVAVHLLGAQGVYRAPSENGCSFMAILNINKVS